MDEPQSNVASARLAHKRNHRFFGWMYKLKDWTESLAQKPYAVPALFLLAIAESSVFPIPPDVLLIALCVAVPRRSFYYAAVCTVGSVIGGIIGYGIGHLLWYKVGTTEYTGLATFFFNVVPGFTEELFHKVQAQFERYDFWVVFTAAFTPIPYKVFTVAAGVFHLNLPMFIIASAVGRAGRFCLVAAMFYIFGAPIQTMLEKYLEHLTLAFVILLIGGFVVVKYAL